MKKQIIRIIAIHSVEERVIVKKLEFTDQDEEFLEDEEGWDSFKDYIDYYVNEEMDTFGQIGYAAISVKEEEVYTVSRKVAQFGNRFFFEGGGTESLPLVGLFGVLLGGGPCPCPWPCPCPCPCPYVCRLPFAVGHYECPLLLARMRMCVCACVCTHFVIT